MNAIAATRLFFVDHLRVALTILVVLHHLSVIYAANTPFYYLDIPAKPAAGGGVVLLVLFQLLNQAYFMGFFFLLAGYVTPRSFDRKGPALFLKDRLLRLGLPLIAFMLVLGPIASIGSYQMPAALTGLAPFSWEQYPGLVRPGPLWFLEFLLIFAFGYAAWRWATKSRTLGVTGDSPLPSYRAIGAFILVLALASYLIRIVLPLGTSIPVPLLRSPSYAYLPQYLSFFVLGAVAYRRNWLQTVPGSAGKVGLAAAVLVTLLLFPLAISGGAHYIGGGYWESAVYALWDSIFSVGMCLGFITFFRRFLSRQGRLGLFLSRHAFTVYVIHAPVIVLLALALHSLQLQPGLKFLLAAAIGVPLCLAVAYLVRRIPLASRVL